MGRETLRAQVRGLVQKLNTLMIGATVEELHDIMAVLAASQAHAVTELLAAQDREIAARINPEYLRVEVVAKMTGYSRSWLYEHGETLGIAVRPIGAPGVRFSKVAVMHWMRIVQAIDKDDT